MWVILHTLTAVTSPIYLDQTSACLLGVDWCSRYLVMYPERICQSRVRDLGIHFVILKIRGRGTFWKRVPNVDIDITNMSRHTELYMTEIWCFIYVSGTIRMAYDRRIIRIRWPRLVWFSVDICGRRNLRVGELRTRKYFSWQIHLNLESPANKNTRRALGQFNYG